MTKQNALFREYVEEVSKARENLEFLLSNLSEQTQLEFSADSLDAAEKVYWQFVAADLPSEFTDEKHFAHLLGQFLSQCMVEKLGATMKESKMNNPMQGQPYLDGFGNKEWERIYPVELGLRLVDMPKSQPNFPGVRERRVFASAFEKASSIATKHESKPPA